MPTQRMSRSQFLTILAEKSGLNELQAGAALDTINEIITQQLGKQGPGEILIPGLLKLNVIEMPATGQHEGIHPLTREPITYKARGARKVIRVRPLKALMDAL